MYSGESCRAIVVTFGAMLVLAACGGGGGGGGAATSQNAEFTASGIETGSEPGLVRLTWSISGSADHFVVEANPDGASGFSRIDLNGDGNVDAADVVAGSATAVEVDVPLHLKDLDNALYRVVARDSGGQVIASSSGLGLLNVAVNQVVGYVKAGNAESADHFGWDVALSDDGDTLAASATREDSQATGVGGDGTDNSAARAGAVYVFTRGTDGSWSQQAYLKASNAESNDKFGRSLSLSGDGRTLAVGSDFESSVADGIDGDETDNSAEFAGAAYVFTRSDGGQWSQQAYVKASNSEARDRFGSDVVLSRSGDTLAVAAWGESSGAAGVGGNQADNSAADAGAVYVFARDSGDWTQQAYVKASNTDASDAFGGDLAISDDGDTLAVGAEGEDSNSTMLSPNQGDNSASAAGATYIFARDGGGSWSQQAYLKATNTDADDLFGRTVALSGDGATLAVAATYEASGGTGIDTGEGDNSADEAGAVYVYRRSGNTWSPEAYIKASNTDAGDHFGFSLDISDDGGVLAVGVPEEDSSAAGIDGAQRDGSGTWYGAVYVFTRDAMGEWSQKSYVKASNPDSGDLFGDSVALSDSGSSLLVGADYEASDATGVGGDQQNNNASASGAAYLY